MQALGSISSHGYLSVVVDLMKLILSCVSRSDIGVLIRFFLL
jgi:hypothetical protein